MVWKGLREVSAAQIDDILINCTFLLHVVRWREFVTRSLLHPPYQANRKYNQERRKAQRRQDWVDR